MIKTIFIILPYKESLKPKSAGAVSIYVKDTTKYSKYKKKIKFISSDNIDKKKTTITIDLAVHNRLLNGKHLITKSKFV